MLEDSPEPHHLQGVYTPIYGTY